MQIDMNVLSGGCVILALILAAITLVGGSHLRRADRSNKVLYGTLGSLLLSLIGLMGVIAS